MHVSIVLERLAPGEVARALCGHEVKHESKLADLRGDEMVHVSALGGALTLCIGCTRLLARQLERAWGRAAPRPGTSEVIR